MSKKKTARKPTSPPKKRKKAQTIRPYRSRESAVPKPKAKMPTFKAIFSELNGTAKHLNVGHPTKITEGLIKAICNLIRLGSWLEVAASACNVHRNSLMSWQKWGHEAIKKEFDGGELTNDEKLYADFIFRVWEAAADCEILDTARIDAAAAFGCWQAAAWRLERRFPERWRQRTTHEMQGGDPDKPIRTEELGGNGSDISARRSFLLAVLSGIGNTGAIEGGGGGQALLGHDGEGVEPIVESPAGTTNDGV